MKISKKNLQLASQLAANWAISDNEEEIAAQLQKRDDKIKALRAQVKVLQQVTGAVSADDDARMDKYNAGARATRCENDDPNAPRLHFGEVHGSQSDGYYFQICRGDTIVHESEVFDSSLDCVRRGSAALERLQRKS